MKTTILLLGFIFLFAACNQKNKFSVQNTYSPQVVKIKGYVFPKDSIQKPKVIVVNNPKTVKVGTPKVVLANTNIFDSGIPITVSAGNPKVSIPGKDNFLMPKIVPVIDSPFTAGIPEVSLVKDAYIKDINPMNFSTYTKMQGLKHDNVRCIMQDNFGNIWIGTYGGGVSKYDGKYFTHYTDKEGLCNNNILCIFQDKIGNLWFGSYGGGVSKFDGKYFTNYSEKEGLSNNNVYSIFQDKKGSIWFSTLGGGVSVLGQDGRNFTHYTEKQGLSNNFVYGIAEDKTGNLWFGTYGGGVSCLSQDRKHFNNYTVKEGLSNNNIFSILPDRSGNIWFGTWGAGVIFYDGKNFQNYTVKEGLSNNYIFNIFQDKIGNIWFCTNGGGLTKYDGVRIESIENGEKIPDKDKSDLKKINGKYVKTFTHFTDKEGLTNNIVYQIFQDKSGNIWIGNNMGLSIYNGKSITHYTEKEGLINNIVTSILQDHKGNLWFGTVNGLCKYVPSASIRYEGKSSTSGQASFTYYTKKEGLCDNNIISIFEDDEGNIWFGTYEGGVSRLSADGLFFTNYNTEDGLCSNSVFNILQDRKGYLWFCTTGGLSKFDGNIIEAIEKGKKISPIDLQNLKQTNGKYVTTFTQYTEKQGLSSNFVYSIIESKNGTLWFGTKENGISCLDESNTNKTGPGFIHYTKKEGLMSNVIYCMLQENNGNIWFGTGGGGVYKYDYQTGMVKSDDQLTLGRYTETEGLCNNNVLSIIQDKSENIWFGTRFGMSLLRKNILVTKPLNSDFPLFKNYTYEDGFIGTGCIRAAILEDNTGTIWIGTSDRLTAIHPEGDETDSIPPNVQITGISLFNENISWVNLEHKKDTSFILGNGVRVGDFKFDSISKWYNLPENLSLAYNNNYLTFNFIGISTKSPQKVKYKYKLEGLDENWSIMTNRTEAPYGNLPHGVYTFKVKAMNSEGYWSKEFNYKFTIRPPWWKTWWFRIIEVIALLLAIFLYIKWRERKLKRDKAILERKVKEQTLELSEKNEELITQNEEIESQKNIIENKNKKITDSIRYARNIQHAILPVKEKLNRLLKDHFIFYQPKDIVSGDFYWAENYTNSEDETITLFAAVDCTGHGVPGAFMSLLGYNGLSQAVKENRLSKPGDILNFLSNYIQETLRQRNVESYVKDGMDLFLCALNRKNMSLQYAGVHNSAFLIRNGELFILYPDKHPIAEPFSAEFSSYTNNQLAVTPGDVIYLFTDGFIDQFGGKDRKKFLSKRFRELLLTIHKHDMTEQQHELSSAFDDWKGNNEQYDDVLIIGIKV